VIEQAKMMPAMDEGWQSIQGRGTSVGIRYEATEDLALEALAKDVGWLSGVLDGLRSVLLDDSPVEQVGLRDLAEDLRLDVAQAIREAERAVTLELLIEPDNEDLPAGEPDEG